MVAILAMASTPLGVSAAPLIPTTVVIAFDKNPVERGEPLHVSATVSPNPGGGIVVFGGHGVDVNATTGIAEFDTYLHGVGDTTFTAYFNGFGNFGQSPTASATVTVIVHTVTATLHVPAAPVGRGDPFDVSVDLEPAPPSGQLRLYDMTPDHDIIGALIGSATVTGSSPVTIHFSGLLPDDYLIRAVFQSDREAYTDATSSDAWISVFDRPTTTTMTINPGPTSLWGQPLSVDVGISPVPDDGGVFHIDIDGSVVVWGTLDPVTGVGHATVTPDTPGSHVIETTAGGSGLRWGASTATKTQVVSSTPLDSDPPIGTVSINAGDTWTFDPYVVLSMTESDASPISKFEVSNDGVHWVLYGGALSALGWSLVDSAGGGATSYGMKTVYVRWTDWWGNVSQVATDTIRFDRVPTPGTVLINNLDAYASSRSVTLSTLAGDAGSTVSMSISNDGVSWTTRAYVPMPAWTLSAGTGLKTVHVKWIDTNGHATQERTDSIIFDDVAPVGSISIAGGATSTTSTSVLVSVPATDALSGVAAVALSNDGATWTTRTYGSTQPWTLIAGLGSRTVWAKWQDGAGNWSLPVSDGIELAVPPTTPVTRQAGANRYATAAAVSAATFSPGVPVVYIVLGTNFPDALGAAAAAAHRGGPVLLVAQNAIPAETAAELTRLHPGAIVIAGGSSVVSDAVKTALGAY